MKKIKQSNKSGKKGVYPLLVATGLSIPAAGMMAEPVMVSYAATSTGSSSEDIVPTDENSYTMAIQGQFYSVDSNAILAEINALRKEACEKGYFGFRKEQYRPLKWNAKLQELARARAVEASIYPEHQRLDTTTPQKLHIGETLAFTGSTDIMKNIKLLASERKYYLEHQADYPTYDSANPTNRDKVGHYYTFVNPQYEYVGAAEFLMSTKSGINANYVVGVLNPSNFVITALSFSYGSYYGTDETPLKSLAGKEVTENVTITTAGFVDSVGSKIEWPSKTLQTGNVYKIKAFANAKYQATEGLSYVSGPIIEAPWVSSDPSILEVNRKGEIKALKPGTATISVNVKYSKNTIKGSMTFTVEGNPVTEATHVVDNSVGKTTTSGDYVQDPTKKAPGAKTESDLELATYKAKAKSTIQGLQYLNSDKKYDYNVEIDGIGFGSVDPARIPEYKAKIDEIVQKAQAENAEAKAKHDEEERKKAEEEAKKAAEDAKNRAELASLLNEFDRIYRETTQKLAMIQPMSMNDFLKAGQIYGKRSSYVVYTNPKQIEEIKADIAQLEEMVDKASPYYEQRKAAKNEINALQNLSPEEKKEFCDKVDKVAIPDQIQPIVNKAKEKDTENARNKEAAEAEKARELAEAKVAANTTIEGLNDLTDEEKAAYKREIESAAEKTAVEQVVANATAKNAENARNKEAAEAEKARELVEAKVAANTTIEGLNDLTDEEKAAYKREIESATEKTAVEQTVANATAKNAENAANKTKPVTPPAGTGEGTDTSGTPSTGAGGAGTGTPGTGDGSTVNPPATGEAGGLPTIIPGIGTNTPSTGVQNGWKKIDDKWHYVKDSKSVNGWLNDNGAWYYLGKDGAMKTGWYKVGDTWYHSNNSGAMNTGWLNDNGAWYYLGKDGAMKTGWYKVGDTWYHSDNSGAMDTGWLNINGTWYYLGKYGAMESGWYKVGDTWYHSDNSGAMDTGWLNDNGTWYYLGKYGAMATGWYKVGDSWYYSTESGAMVTGWQLINGAWYFFDNNGHWVK